MNYFIEVNGTPVKINQDKFLRFADEALREADLLHNPDWIKRAVSVAQSDSPSELEDPREIQAYEIIHDLWKVSVQLEKDYARTQQAREEEKATRGDRKIKEEQKALKDAQDAAVAIRKEAAVSIGSRIQEIVGKNFDIVSSGGLIPKKGVELTKGDGLALISSLSEMALAGERMAGISSLSLGDAIVEVERKFGESLDYTQLIEQTGRSETLIRQARMVSQQFTAEERQKQDPHGRLSFSHWVEITGTRDQDLNKAHKAKIAKFAADRNSTTRKVRELVSAVKEVDEDQRGILLKRVDEEDLNTDGAIQATRNLLNISGQHTGERIVWIYFFPGEEVEMKVSNEFNNTFAAQGAYCVKWGTHPKWTKDGLHFNKVPFHRTAPDSLEADPILPEVGRGVYGDFIISQAPEGYRATGTINGEAQVLEIPKATDLNAALRAIHSKFKLEYMDDVLVDEEGNEWNIRTPEDA